MKNQWAFWLFIVGVVVVVLFAFNYQGRHDVVSLSEIFPENEESEAEYEYIFVDDTTESGSESAAVTEQTEEAAQSGTEILTAVQVEIPADTTSAVAETAAADVAKAADIAPDLDKTPFTIQVSSFRNKATAEKALSDVKNAGYPAFIASKDLGAKGVWHRIYIGTFQDKDSASSFLSKVKKDYQSSFIISP